mmetsp:Transcript_1286/g.2179  ORF Transcript_1286/g.2179 Transcript_1286/m.2179 type:complete len:628 (+) Transcript_1286:37-1920(+)
MTGPASRRGSPEEREACAAMVAQEDYDAECMAPLPNINFLGFNQDQTCLAVGTLHGFMIFSTEKFALLHDEACGAVFLMEMLFRTSLVALVNQYGTGGRQQLTMWNTKERCQITQLHFNAEIYGVKMNHRRTVVLLREKIHIFDLKTMKSLHVIDRTSSPWADPALGWLCATCDRGYLATPLALAGGAPALCGEQGGNAWSSVYSSTLHDTRPGSLVGDLDGGSLQHGQYAPPSSDVAEAKLGLVTVVDTYTLKPIGTVLAHKSPVQALCLNPTGQLLATASSKGTMVRVFSVPSLDNVCVFRRGAAHCRILGLLFSRDSAHICCSSSTGTVHIFKNSEKVLGSLPLQSEEATVGAAHREMISRTGPALGECASAAGAGGAAPAVADVAAATNTTRGSDGALACAAPTVARYAGMAGDNPVCLGPVEPVANRTDGLVGNDGEDLSEWNVISERPERLLELCVNVPSYRETGPKKNALQTLFAVSEYALDKTAKNAKSLLNLLPQPCRELVDAPRAFAQVHLYEPSDRSADEHREAGALSGSRGALQFGYVACMNSRPKAEVLVATARGSVHIYDWFPREGGKCLLRREHSFVGHCLQEGRLPELATGTGSSARRAASSVDVAGRGYE